MSTRSEARKEAYARNAVQERARKRALSLEKSANLAGIQLYDPEDYTEEFGELTELGMSCREIVERSDPTLNWFRENVFPNVDRAICITCKRYFCPASVPKGTECDVTCRNSYTGFGTRS